jgi:cytochrome c-type biogenesis protein CcsB
MKYLACLSILFYILSAVFYFIFLIKQKDKFQKSGFFLFIIGFLFNLAVCSSIIFKTGQVPVHNLSETLYTSALFLSFIFILFRLNLKIKIAGIFTAPLSVFIMLAAYFSSSPQADSIKHFDSLWLIIHIVSVFSGEALFAIACGVAILYLAQENTIKTKKRGFFYKRLPSLELLDTANYSCIKIGFIMLTIGIISGFVYAKAVWGRFFGWDPKEVWSVISWIIYAALLHQRLAIGWRGRRAAIMAIIGFATLLFTFFGVNFLFTGHHQEFTK